MLRVSMGPCHLRLTPVLPAPVGEITPCQCRIDAVPTTVLRTICLIPMQRHRHLHAFHLEDVGGCTTHGSPAVCPCIRMEKNGEKRTWGTIVVASNLKGPALRNLRASVYCNHVDRHPRRQPPATSPEMPAVPNVDNAIDRLPHQQMFSATTERL